MSVVDVPGVQDPPIQTPIPTAMKRSKRCVEWRISSGELQRRQRDPGESGAWPSTWRDVADDVVNASQKVSAFKLDPDLSKGKRTLDVKILVNSTPSNSSTQVTITEALTGRNTSYGYPPAVCDPFVKN